MAPSLSVLVPMRHAYVHTQQLLVHLDVALISDDDQEHEVILSPASSSTCYGSLLVERSFESFQVVRLPCAHRKGGRAWRSRSVAPESAHALFSNYFESSGGSLNSVLYWSVPAALNRAARAARGGLYLLLDELALPMRGFLAPLRAALLSESSRIGVAGGCLRDHHGRIADAGLGVAMDRLTRPSDGNYYHGSGGSDLYAYSSSSARRRSAYGRYAYRGGDGTYGDGGSLRGTSWADDASQGGGEDEDSEEVGVPYVRWRGLLTEGAHRRGDPLGGGLPGEVVRGVGLGLTLLRASLWGALGGLNESLPRTYGALDLCLRAGEEAQGAWRAVYVNTSVVALAEDPPASPAAADERAALRKTYTRHLLPAWRESWGPSLAAQVRSGWQLRLPLVWNMECGDGQVRGFTDEAITYASALEGIVDLRLEISDIWHCEGSVLAALPRCLRESVMRMHRRGGGSTLALGSGDGYAHRDGAVLLVHRDPGRYEHFVSLGRRTHDDGLRDSLYDSLHDGLYDGLYDSIYSGGGDGGGGGGGAEGIGSYEEELYSGEGEGERDGEGEGDGEWEGEDGSEVESDSEGLGSDASGGLEDSGGGEEEGKTAWHDDLYGGALRGRAMWGEGSSQGLLLGQEPTLSKADAEAIAPRPAFVIGRSMFETSALPSDWPAHCNGPWVDEIWVPSEFNRHTFASHGVEASKLHVMPQPIDLTLFDAASTKPMALPGEKPMSLPEADGTLPDAPREKGQEGDAAAAPFVFLSVFKFEERKGWDVLLRAYLREFGNGASSAPGGSSSAAAKVLLVLRVSTDGANKAALADLLAEELCRLTEEPSAEPKAGMAEAGMGQAEEPKAGTGKGEEDQAEEAEEAGDASATDQPTSDARFARCRSGISGTNASHGGLGGHWQAAPVLILDEPLDQTELPSLYRAADAFVLPTRGEGWGRPVMEAMAMGVPAIVTNWSGTTAFATDGTAYLLPYTLVEAPTGVRHLWAEPSVAALQALMRRVVERRAEARAVGAAARQHVLAHYSQEAVAERLIRRLRHLEPTLLRQRERHLEERAMAEARREKARARRRSSSVAHGDGGRGGGGWYDSIADAEPGAEAARRRRRQRGGGQRGGGAKPWAVTWETRSDESDEDVPRRVELMPHVHAPHGHARPLPKQSAPLTVSLEVKRARARHLPRHRRRRPFALSRGLRDVNVTLRCDEAGGTCCHGSLVRGPVRGPVRGSPVRPPPVRLAYVLLWASEGRALSSAHLEGLALELRGGSGAGERAGGDAAASDIGVGLGRVGKVLPLRPPLQAEAVALNNRVGPQHARRPAWLLPIFSNATATHASLCRQGGSRLALGALRMRVLALAGTEP